MTPDAAAVPLHTLTALGFGPLAAPGRTPDPTGAADRLARERTSHDGHLAALESCGTLGQRLVAMIVELGRSVTADQLAEQTAGADPDLIARAIDRLTRAGITVRGRAGGLRIGAEANRYLQAVSVSFADTYAITSDVLSTICRQLGIPSGNRKQDRIDAIAAAYADPATCERIRDDLSDDARRLLARIARSGLGPMESERVGVSHHLLHSAETSRYSHIQGAIHPGAEALAELTHRGIVGVAPWEGTLWLWREARPATGTPLIPDWSVAPEPARTTVEPGPLRLPDAAVLTDRCLDVWATVNSAVLKNGDPRLAKTTVRATAKRLGADEEVVDLVARLAISIGLLHTHTTGMTGRGRKRRAEQVWVPDPDLVAAWQRRSAAERWARLVTEWCRPRLDVGHQLLANRHLVLWELTRLPADAAWSSSLDDWVAWFGDEHGSLGHPEAAREALVELRHLGVVTGGDVIALTAVGRLVLERPDRMSEAEFGAATTAVVQPDLTVVAPPDLEPDLLARLRAVTEPVTEGGALVLRLDERRIIGAVQAGETGDSLVAFLRDLSSVPLADPVVRLVHDAAGRAHHAAVHAAGSAVVIDDPADLATACSIKSAKLTRVADTVAISPLTPDKLRAALDRKGLAPHIATTEPAAAATSGPAAVASGSPGEAPADARLALPTHLTATPDLVQRLNATR